jgi:nucleoside-triphosphatase
MAARILLTGPPGCGKTTVIMRTLERLDDIRVAGFYTAEVRKSGSRAGFDAVGLSSGQSVRLASVRSTSKIRVGRYGVELPEFETLLDNELCRPEVEADLVVVDEIGKMECYSSVFVQTMRGLLDGPTPLLATVSQRGTGFIREAKDRKDVEVLTVSTANRDRLPEQLIAHVRSQ